MNNRNYKKITRKMTAATAAALLAMSMGTCAMAETVTEISNGYSASKDVTATYASAVNAAPVYSVDITWGDMDFTYTENAQNEWDPETHTYKTDQDGEWTATNEGGDKVKVANHSNTSVRVGFGYEKSTFGGLTGEISIPEMGETATTTNLKKAVYNDVTEAGTPSATAQLKLTERPENIMNAKTTVGTVTVTLAPNTADTSVTMK